MSLNLIGRELIVRTAPLTSVVYSIHFLNTIPIFKWRECLSMIQDDLIDVSAKVVAPRSLLSSVCFYTLADEI